MYSPLPRLLIFALLFAAAAPAPALEVDTFQEGGGGYFRVVVPLADLAGVPVERCAAVSATPNVPFVFAFDSRRAEENSRRDWRGRRRSAEEERIQEEIHKISERQSELWGEEREAREELEFLDRLAARANSGEVELSPADLARQAEKRAAIAARLSALSTRESELRARQSSLYVKLNEVPRERIEGRVRLVVAGRVKGSGPVAFQIRDRLTGALALPVSFEMPEALGGAVAARETWASLSERAWREMAAATPGDSIHSYLLTHDRIRRAEGGAEAPARAGLPREGADLYSLATGAMAISEALQLDRMTGPIDRGTAEVPLDRLPGPTIKSHDYAAMMEGKRPELWPVERAVPEECWYLHFSTIERQFAFADLLDRWGTSLLHAARARSINSNLKERLLAQLCLEAGALSRLFGERAIEDLALVGGDPLLDEGSDLAAIFRLKNRPLFDANRALRVAEAKRARPDAKEAKETLRGREVSCVTTPDRKIHAFRADLDDFCAVANSRALLERILAAWDGAAPSLAESADFRYMRTIFPARAEREDGFLYLSDAFIRKLVGPAWKIARARRFTCGGSLRTLENAVTLWRAEGGAGAPTVERLVAAGALKASYLDCPDGGRHGFEPESGLPACSHHGVPGRFAPVRELPVTRVFAGEKKAYERFVEEYNRYWTTFFDPVGIRIRLDGDRTVAETCILPLVDNSAYEGLKTFSGGAPVTMAHPSAPGTIAEILLKLDLPRRAKEFDVARMIEETPFTLEEVYATFGDSLGLHFVDAPLRFTFETTDGPFAQAMLRETAGALAGAFVASSLVLPVYASIPVRDEAAADRFVERLCAEASQAANRSLTPFFRTWAETYRVEETDGVPVRSLSVTLFVLKFRLHFTVRDGFLCVATDRDVALDLARGRATLSTSTGNLVLRAFFRAFRESAKSLRIDWAERMRAACVGNLGSLRALALHRRVPAERLMAESLSVLGFAPMCPAGGAYSYDATREVAFCTAHGEPEAARQPREPDPAQPQQAFLDSLATLEVSLSMTPEGILTRVDLSRVPAGK